MRKSNLRLAAVSELPAPQAGNSMHELLVSAAAQMVSAYVVNRPQENINLTAMLADVYAALASLSPQSAGSAPRPRVAIADSVQDDFIICLEDGKKVKMLKRHLKAVYNMTPDEYRARWNLPADYPMVAPNYAQVRSKLAKEIGLGKR